jgi:hypothetical protein
MDNLYLMQTTSGGLKVGRSADPARRRRVLETASGRKIVVLSVLNGRGAMEAEIHQRLAACRRLGEWFALTADSRRVAREVFGVARLPYPIGGGKAVRKTNAEKEAAAAIAALAERIRNAPRKRKAVVRLPAP